MLLFSDEIEFYVPVNKVFHWSIIVLMTVFTKEYVIKELQKAYYALIKCVCYWSSLIKIGDEIYLSELRCIQNMEKKRISYITILQSYINVISIKHC